MSDSTQTQNGIDEKAVLPADWSPSSGEDGLAAPSPEEAELLRDLDNLVQNSATLGSAEMPALSPPIAEPDSGQPEEVIGQVSGGEGNADGTPGGFGSRSDSEAKAVGSPEEWSALAAIGALDGEAVAEMDLWLKTAKPEEIEIFGRRMRLGHALVYSLAQTPPPADLRESLAQSLGEHGKDGRHLYPRRSLPMSQRLAEAVGWPQARLLKATAIFFLLLSAVGWSLAWRGYHQVQRLTQSVAQSEMARQEAEGAHQVVAKRLAFMSEADLRITALQSREGVRDKSAHLLWSPFGRKALLWIGGLPKAPEGKEYALWVALGTRSFAALRFTEASTEEAGLFLDIPVLQEGRPRPIQAFYLTLQPLGALDPEDGERLFSGSAYL